MSSKSRNAKTKKTESRKKTLLTSNLKPEETEGNAVSNSRRYNLRSSSPAKAPAQFPPYKSILKRIKENKSTKKNSHIPNTSENVSIKAKVNGTAALRQKKVKFNSKSCQNLKVLSYGDISSETVKETTKKCDGKNSPPFTHIIQESFCESASKDANSGLVTEYKLPPDEDYNTSKKSLKNQAEERNILPSEQEETLSENQNLLQISANRSETSGEKSPILGLFCQNRMQTKDDYCKIQDEDLNKRHDVDKRLLNIEVNETPPKIENFRILKEVKTPETSFEKNILLESKTDKNSEIQSPECGDQGNKFNFMEESALCIVEKEHNASESSVSDISESSVLKNDSLMPLTIRKPPTQNQVDQERFRRKDLFTNEDDEQINRLTMKFLQNSDQRNNIKKKGLSKKHDGIDIAQVPLENGGEFSIKPREEETDNLLYTIKHSIAEKLNTPQKTLPFHKTLRGDLNKRDSRSPSKIPRLICHQTRKSPFNLSSKAGLTPFKTKVIEDKVTQKNINYCLISEDEANEDAALNESIKTPDCSLLSGKHEMFNSVLENTVIVADSSRKPDSPMGYQEKNMLRRKEVFPESDEDFVSCISDDEADLHCNSTLYKRKLNNGFKFKRREKNEVIKGASTSIGKYCRTPDVIRRLRDDLIHNESRNSPLNLSSKSSLTPIRAKIIEDEITQKQEDISFYLISEEEVNKGEELNESISTSSSSLLSEELEMFNTMLENTVIEIKRSRQPGTPICYQEEDIRLLRKNMFPDSHKNSVNCISDYEPDLNDNSAIYKRELSDALECRNREKPEVLKKTNTSTGRIRKTSKGIRRERDDMINNEKFCSDNNKTKSTDKFQKPLLKDIKEGISGTNIITMSFSMSLLLYILIAKILGYGIM